MVSDKQQLYHLGQNYVLYKVILTPGLYFKSNIRIVRFPIQCIGWQGRCRWDYYWQISLCVVVVSSGMETVCKTL